MFKNPEGFLDGKRIIGMYHSVPFTGTIVSSRSRYGGGVQHYVILDNTIGVYGQGRKEIVINSTDEHDISIFSVMEDD